MWAAMTTIKNMYLRIVKTTFMCVNVGYRGNHKCVYLWIVMTIVSMHMYGLLWPKEYIGI
jgi:hypothetical protein